MNREIELSNDADLLFEHCIDAAIENNYINGCTFDGWRDGFHVVNTYLEYNEAATRDTLVEVAGRVSDWLRALLRSAVPVPARRYEPEDRAVMISKEAAPSERYYWASPIDGSPMGSGVDAYVRFLNQLEAEEAAIKHGYSIISREA